MGIRDFVTLGMFIIDDFSFMDEVGNPTGRTLKPQERQLTTEAILYLIGGGGTYASIGARIWLPPNRIGMIIDEGHDFPSSIKEDLLKYGEDMWMFRPQPGRQTTRALNSYRGEKRGFEYTTPRLRITPNDLEGNKLEKPKIIHFICSPSRASAIMSEVKGDWKPITVYEPIPYRCVPEELPALKVVLPQISILSPNAEEALSLLSITDAPSKTLIEGAADKFLEMGIGENNTGYVVIRSGPMGAYIKSRTTTGRWVGAYWTSSDSEKIVDVTGAGNSFLGGFAAGMILAGGDVYEATLLATVSASFVIEQEGLPKLQLKDGEKWNEDNPQRRLQALRKRLA